MNIIFKPDESEWEPFLDLKNRIISVVTAVEKDWPSKHTPSEVEINLEKSSIAPIVHLGFIVENKIIHAFLALYLFYLNNPNMLAKVILKDIPGLLKEIGLEDG